MDSLQTLWARVVDYRAYPEMAGHSAVVHAYLVKDPASGAYLVDGHVKKSWLQSCPWMVVPLVMLAFAWIPARFRARRNGPAKEADRACQPPDSSEDEARQNRELRAIAWVIFPTLLMFGVAGSGRTDGLCFNQRYLIELMALVVAAWALSLVRFAFSLPFSLTGLGFGVLAAGVSVAGSTGSARAVSLVPLAIAGALLVVWIAPMRSLGKLSIWLLAGLSVGWALGVHGFDDLAASRARRRSRLAACQFVEPIVPQRAALFAWWGAKDAFGPLQLDHDLVIVDAWADQGKDAPVLVEALLGAGRRVLVLLPGFPNTVLDRMTAGRLATVALADDASRKPVVIEIARRPAEPGTRP